MSRRNFVPNPSAEIDISGWTANGVAPTPTRELDALFAPGTCFEAVSAGTNWYDGITMTGLGSDPESAVIIGNIVTVGFDGYVVAGAGTVQPVINEFDSGGVYVSGDLGTLHTLTSSVARYTQQITITTAADRIGVTFTASDGVFGGVAETFRISRVTMEIGATSGSWFDGSSNPYRGIRSQFELRPY